METSVRAHIASNWIELIAIPIAAALMETQPLLLAIQLIVTHFFTTVDNIDAASIAFFLLFFNWWALWGRSIRKRRGILDDSNTQLSIHLHDVLGILLAAAVFGLTHLFTLADILTPVLAIVLIGWAWKRGIDRAQTGLDESQLILWFKIGFGIMLVVMGFSLFDGFTNANGVTDEILSNLPIFFLAGVLALSFTRIGAIQKEQAQHHHATRQEGTNTWIVILTLTWIFLVIVSIASELLPTAALITILSPLWWLIGMLIQILFILLSWLINGVFFLYALILGLVASILPSAQSIKKPPTVLPQPVKLPTGTAQGNSPLVKIIEIALVIIVLLAVTLFIRSRQKDPLENTLAEEEEVREGLDALQIRRERRLERQQGQQEERELAALDPNSARIRYREFLQLMEEKGDPINRRVNETPDEYQQRLLATVEAKLPAQATEIPSDRAILATLTEAYVQERYGGKKLEKEQQNYLYQWLPHLLQQLNEQLNIVPRATQKRPYQPSRWGED